MSSDVHVQNVTPPSSIRWTWALGLPLTLLGMVAVMNVVNFTDGADGLAAGVCTIAASPSRYRPVPRPRAPASWRHHRRCRIGFLWHNFHPAPVFMGDSGSNLLGLLWRASRFRAC